MLALLGVALNLSIPSPLVKLRTYEAYLRGPSAGPTFFFGTVPAYRLGQQFQRAIAAIPEPQDAFTADYGIQENGDCKVVLSAPENDEDGIAAQLYGLATTAKNQLVDLELVMRVPRQDGTSVAFINERRSAVKSTRRIGNRLELTIVDVDRSGLQATIPSRKYSTVDFPKLYTQHVGRYVPQVIGTGLKMPLTYVDPTPGAFRYIACEVIAGQVPAVLTVYREGRFVTPAEYSTDTVTLSGVTYLRITFAKEQVDKPGALYNMEADLFGPGSRVASDEVKRLLQLATFAVDGTFDAAGTYGAANGMLVDCPYVNPRTTITAVQDLLQVARGQLTRNGAGEWGLAQDRPRECRLVFDDSADEVKIDFTESPEIDHTITLNYRPKSSQSQSPDDFSGKISRTTNGVNGETVVTNPYVRDHETADRLLCFLQQQANALLTAQGTLNNGVMMTPLQLLAIQSGVLYNGRKVWSTPKVARPADSNTLTMREYVESVYTYNAGNFLADARNGYGPDLALTPPNAPTNGQILSLSTAVDAEGKTVATASVRATPPVAFATMWALATDLSTNEVYKAQLALTGGNYDGTISGMRPNRPHTVVFWAENATPLQGLVTAAIAFTTANFTVKPNVPTGVGFNQTQSKEVTVAWAAAADVSSQPKVRRYVPFLKTGGGSFVQLDRTPAQQLVLNGLTHGVVYQVKVRAEDEAGNESDDSSTVSFTPVAKIDDGMAVSQGLSGLSIANGSINQGRSNTATGSITGTAFVGGNIFGGEKYSFWINGGQSPAGMTLIGSAGSPTDDQAQYLWTNTTGASATFFGKYRYFTP
jgi:hypothetical protein